MSRGLGKDPDDGGEAPVAGLFPSTRWSLVQRARDSSHGALGGLCETYRQPLLVWLRAQGCGAQDAEDAVHGFLEKLLGLDRLVFSPREHTKFRTYLLECFKNHLRDERDKARAIKRGGGTMPVSLDETDADGHPVHTPASRDPAPDHLYDRACAEAVVSSALRRLQEECTRAGRPDLCTELIPFFYRDETAASLAQIAARNGTTEGALKVWVCRLRKRLREVIEEEVLQTVAGVEDVPAEVGHLYAALGPQHPA